MGIFFRFFLGLLFACGSLRLNYKKKKCNHNYNFENKSYFLVPPFSFLIVSISWTKKRFKGYSIPFFSIRSIAFKNACLQWYCAFFCSCWGDETGSVSELRSADFFFNSPFCETELFFWIFLFFTLCCSMEKLKKKNVPWFSPKIVEGWFRKNC